MDVQVFQSYSVDDTFSFGIRLGESCSPGDIILLNGDLGVGKTVLSKGIGYEDYFYGQGLCLVEWASLIEEILPDHAVSVTIEKDLEQGTDYRKITVGGFGRKMEA